MGGSLIRAFEEAGAAGVRHICSTIIEPSFLYHRGDGHIINHYEYAQWREKNDNRLCLVCIVLYVPYVPYILYVRVVFITVSPNTGFVSVVEPGAIYPDQCVFAMQSYAYHFLGK